MRAFARLIGGCLCIAALATGANARAEDAPRPTGESSQASSLADRLFDDGRELADRGDHEGACAKFEASLKLDPRAVGTLLHIATCKENTGKLATAWGLYGEVAMRSRGIRADRHELAEARRRELGARLSSIVLRSPPAHPIGYRVTIDGLALDEGAWSSALPVDGGDHIIEATAPGFVASRTQVRLALEKQKLTVDLPTLLPAPPAPRAAESPSADGVSIAYGMALTGVGVLALGVGGALGIDVLRRSDAPRIACPDPCVRGSDAASESRRRYDALEREAIAADILIPVGAVVAAVGVYLWVVAPRASHGGSSAGLRAWISPSLSRAGLAAAF